ncbi:MULTISPECIES: hypothetical protein [unclassified Saccharibacter]|uniref:hypothetical protein n=1 Tax=unclassified Saccharibacter TaxID=2648722 RepID=UPI00135478AA|nr:MULTISPECIES: hypothetical protein [unclassified Saccharibacter]MXV58361.1 hypothetical protein [Saccharibacter sp. EH70]MXV65805.1 hypothetical protein [Saccharibacter sp. EH60]
MKSIEWSPTTGADKGKRFIITRMSAFAGDRWGRNVVRSLARSGSRTPREALEVGIAGLAGQSMAVFGNLTDEECDYAFQGLQDCVTIDRDPSNEGVKPAPLTEMDIDDPQTLPDLRTEAFKLNVDFLKAATFQIYPLIEALRPTLGLNDPEPPHAA